MHIPEYSDRKVAQFMGYKWNQNLSETINE